MQINRYNKRYTLIIFSLTDVFSFINKNIFKSNTCKVGLARVWTSPLCLFTVKLYYPHFSELHTFRVQTLTGTSLFEQTSIWTILQWEIHSIPLESRKLNDASSKDPNKCEKRDNDNWASDGKFTNWAHPHYLIQINNRWEIPTLCGREWINHYCSYECLEVCWYQLLVALFAICCVIL